jgi:branched-chain amino acid aminotransferase
MVKDGVISTPVANRTFLNGITRQRVIRLLRDAGREVQERTITFDEVLAADELFSSGNYAKIKPCLKIEERTLPLRPGHAAGLGAVPGLRREEPPATGLTEHQTPLLE